MKFIEKRGEDSSTNGIYEENKKLKEALFNLKKEINRVREPPLLVCEVVNSFNKQAIVRLNNGNTFLVHVAAHLEGKLKAGDRVLTDQKTLHVHHKLNTSLSHFNVEGFIMVQKPKESWKDVGGLQNQIQELREVVELPLKSPELFEKIGITPPRGILLYGPSGTGKTLMAKAVAESTNSTFIEVIGSELVQKFIGDGARLVREIFKLAREKAPSIIFIDELDSIAAQRVELGTSGEREVQRTFMQLLGEIDGFNKLEGVKVIGATNRIDILDPAILRPGRFDRIIQVPLPDVESRKDIFKIHSKAMRLEKIDVEQIAELTEGFSGAEINAMCTESGYFAIRDKRTKVKHGDFINAIKKVSQADEDPTHLRMFG